MANYTNQNGTNYADTLTYNQSGTYHAHAGNNTIVASDKLHSSSIYGGLGNDLIVVGANTSTPSNLTQNKLVGGSGSDTYRVDMRGNTTFVDSLDTLSYNYQDTLELYIDAKNYELLIYQDDANYGAEPYGTDSDMYNTLANFINADADLKIVGNK